MSSSESTPAATQRWRLDIAYDGQGLNGFAYQPEVTTVVGLLRATLASTLRLEEEPTIVGAGRTDAGVHAFAQVIHVDLPRDFFASRGGPDAQRLMRALNRQLRGKIRVLKAYVVDEGFHARFSAQWREYRYLVLEAAPPALALHDTFAWSVQGPLDLAAMNRASENLVGTHDFRAFCRRPEGSDPGSPLRRRVISAAWERLEDGWQMSPELAPALRFTIRAQSFCHNMVRSLTATLVAVGQGRIPESTIPERLESHEREHLPSLAPAAGLSLVGVGYSAFAGGPSGFVR
ncbi:MAG: tRNA pseudouridine(38-40) synthase TruA [Acidobacteriota bacterium]|nr:tRNA pseudouridine(38-40) synthase TruA [Acidobacteriota bacterium]MDE3093450.1 tRNA pseudouridine(38-40) synthase TruA [Acidobacteriota bacterium]MDE3139894.1 tRNA pseudouridine(38-40) synthase TruA [Acidobacteriota bacterium]MDE3146207.1 tRNA pseudouridine(38-40) synthase TruA [Acidobacteriota bacterium]